MKKLNKMISSAILNMSLNQIPRFKKDITKKKKNKLAITVYLKGI